jgi:hypothetical protein
MVTSTGAAITKLLIFLVGPERWALSSRLASQKLHKMRRHANPVMMASSSSPESGITFKWGAYLQSLACAENAGRGARPILKSYSAHRPNYGVYSRTNCLS